SEKNQKKHRPVPTFHGIKAGARRSHGLDQGPNPNVDQTGGEAAARQRGAAPRTGSGGLVRRGAQRQGKGGQGGNHPPGQGQETRKGSQSCLKNSANSCAVILAARSASAS